MVPAILLKSSEGCSRAGASIKKLHSDFTCDPGSSLTERDPGNDSRRRSDGIPTGDLENFCRNHFRKSTQNCWGRRVTQIETEIREGDPATEIVAAAQNHHADLIIMGTQGLSELKSMFMGSVTRKVNNLSPIHCLTVK